MTDAALIQSLLERPASGTLPNGQTCIVGCTLYGEARGVGTVERQGIANTIGNRVKAQRRVWGWTPADVCLMRWQYSCWTPAGGLSNYEAVMAVVNGLLANAPAPSILTTCLAVAAEVVTEVLPDIVGGSTHYVTRALLAREPPAWAVGKTPTVVIGSTAFFAGIA